MASAAPGPGDNNWWIAQLYAMPAASGKMTPIYKPALPIAMPRWSPDGSTIAFIEGLTSASYMWRQNPSWWHRVPLVLFTAFAPLCLPRMNVLDGRQSIRRAYTPEEFRALIAQAMSGTGGSFRHSVAPLWIRQMADIRY